MKRVRILVVLVAMIFAGTASTHSSDLDWLRAFSAVAKGAQAYTMSNDDVIAIVKEAVGKMDRTNKVAAPGSAYAARLSRITQSFRKVNGIPLNFKVYITNEVNAFACADGSVRVYSGLMDLMNDDELTGVIGHEIGHVGKEHSMKAFKHELYGSAIIDAAGSLSSKIRSITDSGLANLGLSLMSAKYSRTQEREADDYAYDFLKSCGKSPYNMVKAFQKMQQMSGSSRNQASQYVERMFSTHPQMSERISRLKKRCQSEGYTQ